MTADIRSINAIRADKENNNQLLTPAECLEDAAADIRSGKVKCSKALVLMLDDEGRSYSVKFAASNLRASEMLSLMAVFKAKVLSFMGYNVMPEDLR